MAADISLLFGVLGEGALSGDSGKLIQSQLTQIMAELNKSPLKVKVGLDTTSGGKQSWSSQLQQKLDQISASGKFSAQISTLKLSPGAVSDFKKQITSIVSTLGISTGTEIKVTPKGIDEATRQVEQIGNAASNAAKKATELASAASSVSAKLSGASQQTSKSREEIVAYSTQLNVLKTVLGSVESIYKSASFGNSMLTDPANIDKVTASVNNLKLHIEEASKISIGDIAGLERENELIKQEAKELVELVSVLRQVETAEQAVNTNSPMSTERIAQLASLKSAMDAINSTFNSAVFGKNMITDVTSIQEITNKFVECTVRAKEALATSADDTATLKNRVTLLQENARELQELVTLSRQLETPGVDYEAQFRALKATISSIDSLFNSAIAGKSKFENPAHIAEITSEYERFRTAAKEALDTSQTGNANDLKERVATLRSMASEFQTLVATKRQFEQPGTEFDVQLQTLKATISSIDSLFNSAIAGKSKFENPAYITEVTTEYEKFKRVATEALNVSQTGNTDALKKNVVEVQNAAGEFQKLISLARQLEMPGTDYVAKLREVQVVIRSIKSEFDAIVSGRKGFISEQELQTANALYRQVEEIERRIKSVTDVKGLQNEIPALRSIRSQILDIDEAVKQAKARLDALVAQKDTIGNTLGKLSTTSTVGEERAKIEEITAKYAQWAAKIEEVKAAKSAVPTDVIAAIETEGAAILSNIEHLNEERIARENAAKAASDAAKAKAAADRDEASYQEQKNSALRAGVTLLTQMEKAERDWTAAQSGSSKNNYAGIQSDIASLKEYKRQLEAGEITVEEFRKKLNELQTSFSANSNAIKGAGENMRTLSTRIGNLAQKFSAWLSVSQVIMLGIRSIRRMVSATIELDDAMTQLKIVTRDTSQAYEDYLGKITQTATKIGSAVPDLIDSTTTFARLGYSLEESSALAEFTAMLQNVGDIDVADAQDAITAIVKAFGVSVDEVESIMDKLVITGNNFPISVSQIAEGMNNASSALAAAGNTFEQSVALLTAANTTIQNAAKSSTGLRTIAARLRSTKTELDELGETMTEAEYGDLVAALTKYNVALTDMNGEFRSTYDIVADIAAIWDELSTMEQAALANAIAGVRQQSVFFSMIEQFQEASGAMEDMANSAGTLQRSYATFMESTTAHINQFKAAFQSLSQSTFTADFLNGIIDFGAGILKILDAVSRIVNAVGGLNTVLYTTVGLMVTLNADALFGQLRRLTIPIQSLILNIGVFNEAFASAFAASSIAGATKMTGVVSGLSAGFKALTASATTAQLAVGGVFAAFAAITLIVKLYDALTVSAEEATEQMEKSFSELEEAANKAENLSDELENVRDRIRELEAQDSLTFVEESELQKLRGSIGLLQIQADLAEKERIRKAKEAADDTVMAYQKNFKHDITSDAVQDYIDSSSSTGNNAILFSDESNISAMLAGIEQMKRLRDEVEVSSEDYLHFQGIIDDATDSLWEQANVLGTYKSNLEAIPYNELTDEQKDALDEVNEAIALIYSSLDPAKWKDIQWNNIINSEQYSDDAKALKSLASEATITADTIKEKFPALAKACEDAGLVIDDVANNLNSSFSGANVNDDGLSAYTANLSDLSDVLSELKSSYDILADAQNEMSTDGGLSPETIGKLANAEENYLDYLYEENGVVKLNIEAWKERANAKMLDEMDEIQKEIDSLNEENAALEELIATYEEKRLAALEAQDLTAYYDYYHEIDNLNAKIQENNAVIEENQGKLAVYSSLYGAITGDLDAYASSLQNFSRIANAIDSISNSFQTLADLQATVANGFTMSLDKALEFAKVYPEILNNATAAADGQITLNEDVVNSFIQGKKAEIDAQIDAQIAQLEADKAVLEARMEFSKAELDLAKQVGEGEADIAKEVAEFRLDTANKLVAALIEAGIDEATAFQLACAAMAGNAEEFDRIAMEVCTDVNGNFNEAAYQAAQAIYQNMNSAKKDVASLATQAQQTAEAIAGMADGIKAGSSAIVGGSGGGTTGNGITLNLTGADFKGTDYTYEAKDIGLDGFISDLELDISNYENAIAQIDGQIAALQALKDAPLKSFQSERNGGGTGSDPDNAVKEVEEYIASIEDYREAIERLNRIQLNKANLETQLSNEGDLKKQIELQKELIGIYEEEQDALHVLNDLRDQTITESVDSLRNLGFDVEYDADANELFVKNLEHINELVADNKGEYDTLQEATNALRQETEGLIDTLIELNEANQDGSASWMELAYAIQEANIAIYENTVKERENMIKLTENWLEAAIGENETERVEQYTKDIVSYYKDMQETIHQEAEYYRSLGYSETSDEVSALSDLWWDYESNIRDVKQSVIDYLADIVAAASEMVDEIQNVFDVLKSAADEYADNGGFISVDTLQDIIALGPQYMQYLRDENGLLVINEEAINRVIAAKTQQLALENALSYVERLRLALEEGSIENLNQLLFATTDATNATWGLVYANLALLDLDENQYQAALHNINSLRAIADTTVENIGMVTGAAAKAAEEAEKAAEEAAKAAQKELETLRDELEDMKSAGDDIIKYVMDMLKHRIQQQIDALKEMKTAYSEIIKLKKESLKATKAENDYQKSVAAKVKEMAELQAKMDALSLDSSRDAQAERASLAEKMAELQEDLADKQADYALDATMDSLDKMEEEYHKEKDKEIEILEESISSYQKLYDMAIEYISTHWDTLYSELIAWNTEYGSVLNSEITDAWNNCLAAAERYGSFVDAMLGGIEAEIASINAQIESLNLSSSGSGSSGSPGTTTSGVSASNNVVVGATKDYENEYTSGYAAKITDLVAQMRENSSKWHSTSDTREQNRLHEDSVAKANMISRLGVVASYDPKKGTWTIVSDKWNPSNVGQNLLSSYHTGGFAGVQPTLKQNEIMAVLEKGEAILDAKKEQALYRLIDFATVLSERMSRVLSSSDAPALADGIRSGVEMPGRDTLSNITNSNQTKVEFGDMYIYGANEKTVEQHREVNRKFANDILEQLKIKR